MNQIRSGPPIVKYSPQDHGCYEMNTKDKTLYVYSYTRYPESDFENCVQLNVSLLFLLCLYGRCFLSRIKRG